MNRFVKLFARTALAGVMGAVAFAAQAQDAASYPNKPVKIIVPYAPGGTSDIVPQDVHHVIASACDGLAGEIQRSLDFYLATSGEKEISRVFVCGGSAYLAPLLTAIERRARVPVVMFDPAQHLQCDPKFVNEQELRGRASQFVVALGLGLRRDKERAAA